MTPWRNSMISSSTRLCPSRAWMSRAPWCWPSARQAHAHALSLCSFSRSGLSSHWQLRRWCQVYRCHGFLLFGRRDDLRIQQPQQAGQATFYIAVRVQLGEAVLQHQLHTMLGRPRLLS